MGVPRNRTQTLHLSATCPITVTTGSGGNDSRVEPLPTSPPQPTAAPAAPAAPAAAQQQTQQQAPAQPAAAQPTPAVGVTGGVGCFAPPVAYGSDGEIIAVKQPLDFAAIMFAGLMASIVGIVAFRRRFNRHKRRDSLIERRKVFRAPLLLWAVRPPTAGEGWGEAVRAL